MRVRVPPSYVFEKECIVSQVQPLAYTQLQAAQAIGVSTRTIRRWEDEGLVTGRRLKKGGVKLYPADQLRKLAGLDQPQPPALPDLDELNND